MCLTSVTMLPSTVKCPPKFGYKVFRLVNNKLFGISDFTDKYEYSEVGWNKADTSFTIRTFFANNEYQSGYHIFLDYIDAERRYESLQSRYSWHQYLIKKVEVEDISTWGEEAGKIVFIAGRIKICAFLS